MENGAHPTLRATIKEPVGFAFALRDRLHSGQLLPFANPTKPSLEWLVHSAR
jgi:hypothetical protein